MSKLAIVFIVIVTVIKQNNAVGKHAQEIDIDKLIELVNENRVNPEESGSPDSDDSEDSDSSDELTRSGRVGDDELLEIITQAVNNKNLKQITKDRKVHKPNREERVQNYDKKNYKYDSNSRQSSNGVAQLLEQLLNKRLNDVDFKSQPRAKSLKKTALTPNRLLGNTKSRSPDELDEYSKIYILLNPEAMQKSKLDKSSVNKMISKLLSLSSPAKKDEQLKPKQKRYKGFAVGPDIERRRGGQDRELYAPNDSSDEKPHRGRGNGGGGGGGGGAGHTAIPYIRHRGENIYERD